MATFELVKCAGMHSALIESLSSRVKRCAERACVSTDDFLHAMFDGAWDRTHFSSLTATIDGASQCTSEILEVFERATGASDARHSTLLCLQEVVSRRGLVKPYQRWCPLCLAEMLKLGEVWEPLVWRISCTNVCPVHRVELSSVCPYCGRDNLKIFTSYCRVGCCSGCGRWLGLEPPDSRDVGVSSVFRAYHAARLVSQLPDIELATTRRTGRDVLRSYLPMYVSPSEAARQLGIPQASIAGWMTGVNAISLEKLCDLASLLSVGVDEMLTGTAQPISIPSSGGGALTGRRFDADELRRKCEDALSCPGKITVKKMAEVMGISHKYFLRAFPDLVESTRQTALARRRVAGKQRDEMRRALIADAFKDLIREGRYPSLRQVSERAGVKVGTVVHRYYQEEWRKLEAQSDPLFSKRHYSNHSFPRQEKGQNLANNREKVASAFMDLANAGIYPSQIRILKRVGRDIVRSVAVQLIREQWDHAESSGQRLRDRWHSGNGRRA